MVIMILDSVNSSKDGLLTWGSLNTSACRVPIAASVFQPELHFTISWEEIIRISTYCILPVPGCKFIYISSFLKPELLSITLSMV